MLVTDQAKLIRTTVGDIRIAGRNTQGVTIFKVAPGEHVVSAARIDEEEEPENEAEEMIAEEMAEQQPVEPDAVQIDDGTGPETLPDSQEGE
jgi:DNA gyrase subunit A